MRIFEGATVENAVLMDGVTVEKGGKISFAIVNEGVKIPKNKDFTGDPHNIKVVSEV